MISQKDLWEKMCEMLTSHNQGKDTCVDTLKRLWKKTLSKHGIPIEEVPLLYLETVQLDVEERSTEQLITLLMPWHTTNNVPL